MGVRPLAILLSSFTLLLLLSTPAASQGKGKSDLALGESVYKEICFACHGLQGDGKGPSWQNTRPRPQVFANSSYMSRLTDQYLFEVVKYGKLAVLKREPGTKMNAVAMPAFEEVLEDAQIKALIQFERAFLSGAPQSSETQEIFNDACAVCHGVRGRGDGTRASQVQPAPRSFTSLIQPAPADYTDPLFMGRFDDEVLFALIKKGKIGSIEEMGFDTMRPFGQVLSDREIRGVIRYIRETFINKNINRKK